MNLPLSIKNALNSRVKILSNLDITERRVPQDVSDSVLRGEVEVGPRIHWADSDFDGVTSRAPGFLLSLRMPPLPRTI